MKHDRFPSGAIAAAGPNPLEEKQMVQFAVDPGRSALVIVDMQNCAVMAFGFAEVIAVDQVLSRIPVAATAPLHHHILEASVREPS